MDSGKFRITDAGKLEIGQTIIIVKPTNALNTYSGQEILMIPFDSQEYEPKDYTYSFTYYDGYDFGRKGTPEFFILELLVVTANEEVTLHPNEIALILDGQEIFPTSYYNLERRYQGFLSLDFGNSLTPLCKAPGTKTWSPANPLTLAEEVTPEKSINLEKIHSYCFAIKFKMPPPDPRTSFSIKFNGIKIHGDDIHLPDIRYTPSKLTWRNA
ncbi:MAG TPA: hypothetical protein VMJ33_11505 [Gallionella sp.]|nr:hypothetical protein [Gallionella sp.]